MSIAVAGAPHYLLNGGGRMQVIPWSYRVCFVVTTSLAGAWAREGSAHIVVQVRGTAQIDADVAPVADGDAVLIRGLLRDELGVPIPSAPLRFELARQQDVSNLAAFDECLPQSVIGTPKRGRVETRPDGTFCIRLPKDRFLANDSVYVNFDGNASYGATNTKLTIADWRIGLAVDLRRLSREMPLDRPKSSFPIRVLAAVATDPSEAPPISLRVTWRDSNVPQEHTLGQLTVQLGTLATLEVESTALGEPGYAQLVVSFDGNAFYKPLRAQFPFERIRDVVLTADEWPKSTVVGDHVSFSVTARAKAKHAPVGSVELIAFDDSSSYFRLDEHGVARAEAPVPRTRLHDFVELRFHPDAPGWRTSTALHLDTTILPESRWKPVGWVIGALLMIAWFVLSRLRAVPDHRRPPPASVTPPYAHVELLESATGPDAGWTGLVVDAHDGLAISGAVIELTQAGFDGRKTLLATTSSQTGAFEIAPCPPGTANALCRLSLCAQGFARVDLDMPPPGRVRVHLVSVRRTLLERLVSWARLRGQPFDSKREPTPGWVAEVAKERDRHDIEAWAKAVAVGAFGSEAPLDPDGPELQPPDGAAGGNEGVKRSQ